MVGMLSSGIRVCFISWLKEHAIVESTGDEVFARPAMGPCGTFTSIEPQTFEGPNSIYDLSGECKIVISN